MGASPAAGAEHQQTADGQQDGGGSHQRGQPPSGAGAGERARDRSAGGRRDGRCGEGRAVAAEAVEAVLRTVRSGAVAGASSRTGSGPQTGPPAGEGLDTPRRTVVTSSSAVQFGVARQPPGAASTPTGLTAVAPAGTGMPRAIRAEPATAAAVRGPFRGFQAGRAVTGAAPHVGRGPLGSAAGPCSGTGPARKLGRPGGCAGRAGDRHAEIHTNGAYLTVRQATEGSAYGGPGRRK